MHILPYTRAIFTGKNLVYWFVHLTGSQNFWVLFFVLQLSLFVTLNWSLRDQLCYERATLSSKVTVDTTLLDSTFIPSHWFPYWIWCVYKLKVCFFLLNDSHLESALICVSARVLMEKSLCIPLLHLHILNLSVPQWDEQKGSRETRLFVACLAALGWKML